MRNMGSPDTWVQVSPPSAVRKSPPLSLATMATSGLPGATDTAFARPVQDVSGWNSAMVCAASGAVAVRASPQAASATARATCTGAICLLLLAGRAGLRIRDRDLPIGGLRVPGLGQDHVQPVGGARVARPLRACGRRPGGAAARDQDTGRRE